MAGHSKWANIKHRKAATDAVRGKVFTKIAKELVIAARQGGGDPGMNSSLRLILEKAKKANMPNKNIERAIKRGTGEIEGGELSELLYEGYAPGGVGLIIEVVTDNKNRAVAELRHMLGRNGGNLGSDGAVSWQFTRKGSITIGGEKAEDVDEDELFMIAADAGADDITFGDPIEIYSTIEDFQAVQLALNDAGIEFDEANLIYDCNQPMSLEPKDAVKVMRLVEKLDELDDVQNVFSALDITDEAIDAMMA